MFRVSCPKFSLAAQVPMLCSHCLLHANRIHQCKFCAIGNQLVSRCCFPGPAQLPGRKGTQLSVKALLTQQDSLKGEEVSLPKGLFHIV